jgi:MurNAc alpha-1-phosphate uridylyltransferase
MSEVQMIFGGVNSQNVPAMVLAAGRGERMRPLTDVTPKPLLKVQGKALLQWHLEALTSAGCPKVVLNTAWLGEQIEQTFGEEFKQRNTAKIMYSHEAVNFGAALETAGGIARALPLLCCESHLELETEVFWVLAGDVYMPGFGFDEKAAHKFMNSEKLAHIWLVPNPDHNLKGDFGLDLNGLALDLQDDSTLPRFTYSTVGLYRKQLFELPWCDVPYGNPKGVKAALAPLLRAAMKAGQVSAEIYDGEWTDVGTPERLAKLNTHILVDVATSKISK